MTHEALVSRFLERLDAVERRLASHAENDPPQGLTEPDPPTGERWEAGQVWAHVAEFVPYWMAQMKGVFDRYDGAPVTFGRIKTDPDRLEAIERDRRDAIPALYERTRSAIGDLREWLPTLGEDAWAARGVTPRMRELGTEEMLEEFLVGHLEEHADQLDGLRSGSV
jgi:hypothetical protein